VAICLNNSFVVEFFDNFREETLLMKLSYLFYLVVIISAPACNSKKAYNYSEKIVGIEKSILPAMTKTEEDVVKYAQQANWDSVRTISERMESLVESKLSELKKTPAPNVKEGENFKRAAIDYFQYIEDIYTSYKNVAVQTTAEGRQDATSKMMSIISNKGKALSDMQEAQKKFAKANGFRVENQN
jgi:hypothetical protein